MAYGHRYCAWCAVCGACYLRGMLFAGHNVTDAIRVQLALGGRKRSNGGMSHHKFGVAVRKFAMRAVLVGAGFAVLTASGCVSVRTSHGYILERGETSLSAREGVDTKESIIAKYGEPSMRSTFNDSAWYYLASRDQARAFFRPETTTQQVVAFLFDDAGVVQEVKEINLAQSVRVSRVSKQTPTRGKELSFWEQLLGNVGQLPAGGGPTGPGGGR
ncbi:MAG: outer membrane protein assembly factor BamE [Parvularculaceae bacterium]|nr:MAG: outer membrane protein assembly factor BamE [Parvularculaceae bacterium]